MQMLCLRRHKLPKKNSDESKHAYLQISMSAKAFKSTNYVNDLQYETFTHFRNVLINSWLYLNSWNLLFIRIWHLTYISINADKANHALPSNFECHFIIDLISYYCH